MITRTHGRTGLKTRATPGKAAKAASRSSTESASAGLPFVARVFRPVLILCCLALTAPAQEEADPRAAELERIRAEIVRMQTQLEQMKVRENSLEDRLRRVRLELELQQAELDEATAAVELATARATAASDKVAELEAALVEIRADLKRRLAGMYRLGQHGYLRLLWSLQPGEDLLPAIRQLRFLIRRDQTTLERFRSTREQLQAQRDRLAAERREAERWQQLERQRHDELEALRRRHEAVLEELERDRRRLADRAEELQDKERKLVRLIAALVEDGPAPLAGTPIQQFRGVLDWPLTGEVTAEFGPRRDPRYRTEVPHNGLDIAAAESEVRAVFPGTVLYASQFEGYGTMVVLYHPGQVFTLYARLRELSVAKDDVVSLGDAVGIASETLYFEIRVDNQPEDPRRWLR